MTQNSMFIHEMNYFWKIYLEKASDPPRIVRFNCDESVVFSVETDAILNYRKQNQALFLERQNCLTKKRKVFWEQAKCNSSIQVPKMFFKVSI